MKTILTAAVAGMAMATCAAFADEGDEARIQAFWVSRMAAVAVELSNAAPGYVLVMGDSNAQAVSASPCPGALVNAGGGGIGARRYRELVLETEIPDGGSVAILNVGTGGMVRKRDPMSAEAVSAYEADVSAIVAHLRPHMRRVVVNALPPLGGKFARKLDPEAVTHYSKRIEVRCESIGCTYADPWAGVRGEAFGLARPELVGDGLHPDDANGAYRSIAALACPERRTGTLEAGARVP